MPKTKPIAPFQTRRALTVRILTTPKPYGNVGAALVKAAQR